MKLKFHSLLIAIIISTSLQAQKSSEAKVRHFHDTIGFAKHSWQMDSIISRIGDSDKVQNQEVYKAVINPHDDYKYAAGLYAKTLSGIKANTVVLVGVAHRARNFDLQDKIIFGSFNSWEAPYGNVKVSAIREEILKNLKTVTYVVHDSMMQLEHSLEAIVPFLQHQNKEVQIIPLLVTYMKFEDMQRFSKELSKTLSEIMKDKKMQYGKDLAVVISNDAIHFGSEDWGGSDLAPFGTDEEGNEKAHQKDLRIIAETLKGKLEDDKIKTFNNYTVKPENYKEYNWTWCGRYSVPLGLLFANELNKITQNKNLHGEMLDYRSSLKNEHLQVEDLGMGTTAPSKPTHWVAYVGMAYQ
ncbi:AmmeMemoRadiSam system protein B [Christiangramia sediminis]|uniref:AmmeMemoRadiSam system protein B n=1 Tax=Christiangramia sediminis TaxID=2881336 RepID=A0A9X1LIG6_9FLAO|nr:AmmeMemoRadiSam system protein B [Christiangramia sediminis]MCB7481001.1 AmmeMemoRadiSam system protein B [Christiangramia sediminis]